ncbi:unnamed protein product [Miscanthus lutarioriparius]|uniref:F-box domain-containing protein n=1 Tax=Miscanthus lutarioriparius TaxID=422564 RepID=A0A811NS88_9POAL|nr:unnamed protein product [Miscanthus lutarioriparius]
MEKGGGGSESAAKRARLSSGDVDSAAAAGEDRLSALHDDVLVSILLHLSTRAAARTTVLSGHWRRIWALLPELRFGVWLPAAAPRVSGVLTLLNYGPRYGAKKEDEAAQRGAFELPCFEKATAIYLLLDFLGLAMPPADVSTRLTRIYLLLSVWFHGPGDLGDVVSSPRCPCLQRLDVDGARGLGGLSIHSESMLQLELKNMRALSQLTVVAPALKELTLEFCFAKSGPVANITTPLLANLVWNDVYDLSSVNLGKMEHLRLLGTYSCFVYEYNHFMRNQSCVSLLQRFEGIETLLLTLAYPLVSSHFSYLDRIMPLPSYLYHGSLSIQVLM